MERNFEKTTFSKRLATMLKVDFKRMFTMPLAYIMAAVCFALPILILVMTASVEDTKAAEETTGMFTSVWQAIGSVSGNAVSMDLTGMSNQMDIVKTARIVKIFLLLHLWHSMLSILY